MDRLKPAVLTFDVVGTLIDFEAGMIRYIRDTGGAGAAALDDEAILASYREREPVGVSARYPDSLVAIYGAMARQLGLPESQALAEGFRDSVAAWPAFPDSVAALKRLRAHFKLVAMTNARRWALDLMARTLDQPFDDSLSSDDALCEKPDPRYFAFVRGRLSREGHGLHDILHVAQSQYHDIGVARQLGYTVCWIERRRGKPSTGGTPVAPVTTPDYCFATLAELADAADAGTIRMNVPAG